jgi:hypothetical protein
VAFVAGDAIEVLPARAWCDAQGYRFGIRGAGNLAGREVVLLIDDGQYWFELRGVSVRGVAAPLDSPPGDAAAGLSWYAVGPRRVLAWDYATLREEGGG